MSRRECIIFDLDGTLCNTDHRLHHIKQLPKNWGAFHDACVDDQPNKAVQRLCQALGASLFIAICSGRPDSHMTQTMDWLEKHNIQCDLLLMRKAGDYRPDTAVKADMLEVIRNYHQLDPIMAVDDRPSIIKLWREAGIPTLEIWSANWDGTPERPT